MTDGGDNGAWNSGGCQRRARWLLVPLAMAGMMGLASAQGATKPSGTSTEPPASMKAADVIRQTPEEDVGEMVAPGSIVQTPEETVATPSDTAHSSKPLTLANALAEVWTRNPQVTGAQLALTAAGYDIAGSRTGYYPYVAIQSEQDKDRNTGLVRVIQPLWNGGLTGAQVDIARAQQKSALATLNRTRLDLGLRTAEAYLNAVATAEQSRQWKNYIDELTKLLQVIKRRADEGVAPQADVQTAQTRLSQAQAGYQANLSLYESNRAQLASLLNFMPGDLKWPEEDSKLSMEEIMDAGRNLDVHPEVQLAYADIQHQQSLAQAAKASIWPQINGEYRRGLRGFSTDSGNDDSFLLALQYQTDSGFKAYQQYRADQQRAKSAEAGLEAAKRGVLAAIRIARTNRQVSEAQFAVQVEAATASRALVESFLRQFDVGRKTWLEVLNAQREANDTILSAISVRRQVWFSNAQLGLQGLYWRRLTPDAPQIDVIDYKQK